eukprot:TRINITY_DN1419_c0_g1_i7.p2 TRINITY_DN1419_c0_g1~~TRINITY_DN1419_c0_g1_i7.p2  ORF type:complete len:255 (-),score=-17.84 TRINITY_DN1419_c0_g1_i7:358-1122(-)
MTEYISVDLIIEYVQQDLTLQPQSLRLQKMRRSPSLDYIAPYDLQSFKFRFSSCINITYIKGSYQSFNLMCNKKKHITKVLEQDWVSELVTLDQPPGSPLIQNINNKPVLYPQETYSSKKFGTYLQRNLTIQRTHYLVYKQKLISVKLDINIAITKANYYHTTNGNNLRRLQTIYQTIIFEQFYNCTCAYIFYSIYLMHAYIDDQVPYQQAFKLSERSFMNPTSNYETFDRYQLNQCQRTTPLLFNAKMQTPWS